VATIEIELDELVGVGVLNRQRIGDLIVYSLADDRRCVRLWISLSWPAMTGNFASRPSIISFGE